MSKTPITFEELNKKIYDYRKERSWLDADPADLAKSIVLEAAELLEHYQWDNTYTKKNERVREKNNQEIAPEVADIFIYLLEFCQDNQIDLLQVAYDKIGHNSKKYPARDIKQGGQHAYEKAKRRHRKVNKLT